MKKNRLLIRIPVFIASALLIAFVACSSSQSANTNENKTSRSRDSVATPKSKKTAPPLLVSPANGAVINGQNVTFYWHPVKGGAEYILQTSADSAFKNPKEYKIKDTIFRINSSLTIINWRVKSVQEKGDTSLWSSTFHFQLKKIEQVNQYRPCNGNCGACTHPCGRRRAPEPKND